MSLPELRARGVRALRRTLERAVGGVASAAAPSAAAPPAAAPSAAGAFSLFGPSRRRRPATAADAGADGVGDGGALGADFFKWLPHVAGSVSVNVTGGAGGEPPAEEAVVLQAWEVRASVPGAASGRRGSPSPPGPRPDACGA